MYRERHVCLRRKSISVDASGRKIRPVEVNDLNINNVYENTTKVVSNVKKWNFNFNELATFTASDR